MKWAIFEGTRLTCGAKEAVSHPHLGSFAVRFGLFGVAKEALSGRRLGSFAAQNGLFLPKNGVFRFYEVVSMVLNFAQNGAFVQLFRTQNL